MALTRSFKELVQKRVASDPAFGEALLREGIDTTRRRWSTPTRRSCAITSRRRSASRSWARAPTSSASDRNSRFGQPYQAPSLTIITSEIVSQVCVQRLALSTDPCPKRAEKLSGKDWTSSGNRASLVPLRGAPKALPGSRPAGTQPKSLIRMFGPRGNPQARNLFGIIGYLQKQAGVELHVR
jgi:hypothetical protein